MVLVETPPHCKPLKTPPEILRQTVAAAGVLSFARFMELALYHPEWGYYERTSAQIGRQGDFYTSVSVGPLFGELLAFQFAEWQSAHPAQPFQILEAPGNKPR
jgi:SAM-dependent MidA family methyltransferase